MSFSCNASYVGWGVGVSKCFLLRVIPVYYSLGLIFVALAIIFLFVMLNIALTKLIGEILATKHEKKHKQSELLTWWEHCSS